MARSLLDQLTQVSSTGVYADNVGPGLANNETTPTTLEEDLNNLRSRIKAVAGTTKWYDDPSISLDTIANKYFIARVSVSGFEAVATGTGTSSTAFDTAIQSITGHNDGGGNASTAGVVVNATKAHKLHVRVSSTQNPVDDGSGNEVYGRLVWTGTAYRIDWFSYVSGTETAYNFTASQIVDLSYVLVSRAFGDIDWSNLFTDGSFHDNAGLTGTLDDTNVTTGGFSFLLEFLTNQDAVNTKVDNLGSTANGEGASGVAIEDASAYYAGTDVEAAFNELEAQIGGDTSSTYNFTEANLFADNDAIYAALEKIDLFVGDLASVDPGEGASLIGIEDSAGNFTATTVEGALSELFTAIDDVNGWTKLTEGNVGPFTGNHDLPGAPGTIYTPASGANMDVYDDGQLLFHGAGNDYTEVDADTINFLYTVKAGSNLTYMIRK